MPDERALQQIWYGGQAPSFGLKMLAGVYGAVAALRRALFRSGLLKTQRLPVPVVVVGNITVGGTGKTPLVIALIEAMRMRGYNPGVVSRGYAGSAAAPLRVEAQADPAVVGDEARLIRDATGAPVVVGRDRVAAARLLIETAGVDLIIADDGLQHYRLGRDVEICVIDGERRFGNGRLLPAGPLREPLARLDSVAFRVVNGGVPEPGEVAMQLIGTQAAALLDPTERQPLAFFHDRRVHAVAGIGHPQRFFAQLRAAGVDAIEHAFPDHHAFVPSDLAFGDDLAVLMTAKDAVKCRAFAQPHHWCVPVRAQLPPEFIEALAASLASASVRARKTG
ncbi:MAG TPA: tetraacyldisaccharide 4'-kinase [Rudaea sp.]